MAEHVIGVGQVAVHNVQLVPNVVETFVVVDEIQVVEIISDGSAAAYYTVNGSEPTLAGPNTRLLPAGGIVIDERHVGRDLDAVKVISAGSPVISIQRV